MRLGRFLPAHLCRFAVRSPGLHRPRGYFLAVWSELLPESRSSRLLTPPHPPDRDLPRSIIGLEVWRANHTAPEPFPPASPLGLHPGGGGILTPLPIPYAFRPQVRGRLTLGGRPFPRKPWAYGGRDSHPPYRVLVPGFSPPGPPVDLVGLPSSATGVLPYRLHAHACRPAASAPGLSPE